MECGNIDDCPVCISGFESHVSLRSHLIDHALGREIMIEPVSIDPQLLPHGSMGTIKKARRQKYASTFLASSVIPASDCDEVDDNYNSDQEYAHVEYVRHPSKRKGLRPHIIKPTKFAGYHDWDEINDDATSILEKPSNLSLFAAQNLVPVTCFLCDMNFRTESELLLHIGQVHPLIGGVLSENQQPVTPILSEAEKAEAIRRVRAEAMQRVNQAQAQNKAFLLSNNIRPSFSCNACFLKFTDGAELIYHARSHRIFTCTVCNKVFYNHTEFVCHLQTHTQSELRCQVCQVPHSDYEQFTCHIATHKIFQCKTCQKCFPRHSLLAIHIRSSHMTKIFKCAVCQIVFPDLEQCQSHVRTHGTQGKDDANIDVFTCTICSIKFDMLEQCTKHMQVMHCISTPQNPQRKTGYVTSTDNALRYSGQVEPTTKLFRCSICRKTFLDKTICEEHISSHQQDDQQEIKTETGDIDPVIGPEDKMFACAVCKEVFTDSVRCLDHMKIHLPLASITKPEETPDVLSSAPQNGTYNASESTAPEVKSETTNPIVRLENAEDLDKYVGGDPGKLADLQLGVLRTLLQGGTDVVLSNQACALFRCGVCKKTFTDKTLFEEHVKTHIVRPIARANTARPSNPQLGLLRNILTDPSPQTVGKLTCKICKVTIFGGEEAMKIHHQVHQTICYLCSQYVDDLQEHIQTAHKCPICKDQVDTADDLENHMTKHHMKCDVCDGYVISREALANHREVHPTCDICKTKFKESEELQEHVKYVHRAEWIECTLCKKHQRSEDALAEHIDKMHPECPKCAAVEEEKGEEAKLRFTDHQGLAEHMQSEHGFAPTHCWICDRTLNRGGMQFINHIKTHKNKTWPPKCKECKSVFTSESNLRIHMLMHTQAYPLQCEICGLGQIHKSRLERHMLTHSETRLFTCNICDKSFKDKTSLGVHITTHGERKFQCDRCPKSFTRQSYLDHHLLRHSPSKRKIYTCEICLDAFLSQYSHTKHMQKKHPESVKSQVQDSQKEVTEPSPEPCP